MTTTERSEDGYLFIEDAEHRTLSAGLLGATIKVNRYGMTTVGAGTAARLEMIERRILRMEAAIADHGISLEQFELGA